MLSLQIDKTKATMNSICYVAECVNIRNARSAIVVLFQSVKENCFSAKITIICTRCITQIFSIVHIHIDRNYAHRFGSSANTSQVVNITKAVAKSIAKTPVK